MNLRTRFAVLERDGWRCRYCGDRPSTAGLQVDHVHPVSRGGADALANLVASCRRCNLGKTDRSLLRPPPLTESERRERWSQGWDECSSEVMSELLRPFDWDESVLDRVAATFGDDADRVRWLLSRTNGQGVIAWACLEANDADAAAMRAVVEWLLARAGRRFVEYERRRAAEPDSFDDEAPL